MTRHCSDSMRNLYSSVMMPLKIKDESRKEANLTYLTKIIEVVFPIDPSILMTTAQAVAFISDCRDVRTFAVVHGTFEQLYMIAMSLY